MRVAKLNSKQLIDLIPLVLLIVLALISLIEMIAKNYIPQWQHYLGLILLVINILIIIKHHQKGVLFLGLVLILALINIVSFNAGIIGSSLYWTPFSIKIPLFSGNPIILLLLILHFVLSGRFYFGILTNQYWKKLFERDNSKQA